MKILHVVVTCDAATGGGLAERTRHLSKALVGRGAECTVLTLDIGMDAQRRREWSHCRLMLLPCLNRRFYVPLTWPGQIAAAVAAADVVDITSHWTLLNALVYRAARRSGATYLVHPAGALGIVGRSARIKRAYNVVVGREIILHAGGHIAITKGEVPQYEAYGISQDRITFIPNGVDAPDTTAVNQEAFLARHGLEGRRVILFVGRLGVIKGPDLLLEAFASVSAAMPDHALVFAGPDLGLLDSLKRAAVDRGVANRVRFVGYLDGADKESAYAACDFLALPSRREAMSLVALEAGVRGKPVLLTDQCGFDEVGSCGGGHVVGANVAEIGAGLRAMVAHQQQLPAMGQALQSLVQNRFTWPAAADTFLELCARAARQAGGRSTSI